MEAIVELTAEELGTVAGGIHALDASGTGGSSSGASSENAVGVLVTSLVSAITKML